LLGAPIARVVAPTGIGSRALDVIRDGDVPAAGSTDAQRQYDTFDGNNTSAEDWVGYSFSRAQTFNRIALTEGLHFTNGGWFESLTVQVRQGGVWSDAAGVRAAPAYRVWNDGVGFETYVLTFTPVSGDGIRVFGRPGGSADFISIGELRVFGSASSTAGISTCVIPPSLDQSRPNGDYFRQLASDNSIANSNRQRVRSAEPTAICAVTAYFWNAGPANGAEPVTGAFHLEIWSDAGGVPGVQVGGSSSTVDAASLPTVQGDAPTRTVVWPATARPQPAGDFWIVLQSDSLSNDQLAWSAVRNDSFAHADAAYNAFKANNNLGTDFHFRVFVEP
jgi:hypothetical protein